MTDLFILHGPYLRFSIPFKEYLLFEHECMMAALPIYKPRDYFVDPLYYIRKEDLERFDKLFLMHGFRVVWGSE